MIHCFFGTIERLNKTKKTKKLGEITTIAIIKSVQLLYLRDYVQNL